jgi:hypothetical protein
MKRRTARAQVLWVCGAVLAAALGGRSDGAEAPAAIKIAFLAPETSADKLGPEARAAYALAGKLHAASLILPAAGGKFVGPKGESVALDGFAVI